MKKLTILLVLLVAGGVCIAGCTTEENGEVLPTETPEATETVPEEVTTPPTEEVTEEPTEEEVTEEPTEEEVTGPTANLVETAADAGQFTTLVAAIEAAGLTEELSTGGPYTIFAPTDAAFAAIPAETLDALLASPDEELTEILTYHVVDGEYYAEDLTNVASLDTLQGTMLTISIDGDTVMVDGAQVIDQDIQASNGVIHVIDEVLVPIGVELPAATDGEMEEATEEMTEEVTEEMTEEETETPE
ncbi:MAG: fasciclin domain-containing protein [Methanomicrobiaceae archaeon]|nr:fasciclin domain-containing protein [Methanomicrobiaceae archaeon]